MRRLLMLVLPLALVATAAPDLGAQENAAAGVNDACCGKICFAPSGCAAPTNRSSKRCEAMLYNAETDLPGSLDVPPSGVTGCVQVNGAAAEPLACIGGRANEPNVPTGCVCAAGTCETSGTSGSCTGNAVLGCEQAGSIVVDDDDPDCGPCPG